jgi:hypothetical protein
MIPIDPELCDGVEAVDLSGSNIRVTFFALFACAIGVIRNPMHSSEIYLIRFTIRLSFAYNGTNEILSIP